VLRVASAAGERVCLRHLYATRSDIQPVVEIYQLIGFIHANVRETGFLATSYGGSMLHLGRREKADDDQGSQDKQQTSTFASGRQGEWRR
jgi:hypothetical protein